MGEVRHLGRPLRSSGRLRHSVLGDEPVAEDVARASSTRGIAAPFATLRAEDGGLHTVLTRGESLLLHALQRPAWDTALFGALLGPEYLHALADLLALGALETDGPPEMLRTARAMPDHPLARLAADAVEYGSRFADLDVETLARRLYQFNTLPLRRGTPLRTIDDVLAWLAGDDDAAKELLRRRHRTDDAWIRFEHSERGASKRYKLYVSTPPEDVPAAFRGIARSLATRWDWDVKVATSPALLGRPDRLVVHFETSEGTAAATAALAPILESLADQGVPFSEPLLSGANLSRGVDPPSRDGLVQSWRQRTCLAIATALLDWRAARSETPPRDFVMERMERGGIDTRTWRQRVGTS